MNIYWSALICGALGGFGGFINCVANDNLPLPRFDKKTKSIHLGFLGNVLTGLTGALVIWGLYGPFASYDFSAPQQIGIHTLLAQIVSSLLVGYNGGKVLTVESEKAMLRTERDEERVARLATNRALKLERKKRGEHGNPPRSEPGASN